MKLQVRVVTIEDKSKYVNKKPRITLRVIEADAMFSEFTLAVETLKGVELGGIYPMTVEGL